MSCVSWEEFACRYAGRQSPYALLIVQVSIVYLSWKLLFILKLIIFTCFIIFYILNDCSVSYQLTNYILVWGCYLIA